MSIMKKFFFSIIVAGLVPAVCCCGAEKELSHFEKADNFGALDHCPAGYLQDIRDFNPTNELNSVMIIKDGRKVLEYYDVNYGPDFLNICWSASKTFTATAFGFAVQDGLVSLDSKLVDYIDKDKLPEHISDTLSSLTMYDLLRMASGFKKDPIGATSSIITVTTPI